LAGQCLHNRFGLALRSPLPVQTRTEARDDGDQIGHYLLHLLHILAPVFGQIDDLDASPVLFSQRFERAEAEARRPICALDHNEPDGRIGEQLQALRAAIGDARAALFDHLLHLLALGGALGDES
jgi:hypothetical protein